MNLTSFTDIIPHDDDSMRDFLDANALAHETIFTALLLQGVVITHYPLWGPQGPDEDWVHTHASEHQAIADTLTLSVPVDIDEVDFKNPAAAEDWFNNHYLAHQQINEALGL